MGGTGPRIGVFAFGMLAYLAFFVTIVYAIGFVNNIVVPKSVSSGTGDGFVAALLVNLSMMITFAIQHTVMARSWFKRWLTRFMPLSMERSVYVLASSAILAVTMLAWRPMPMQLWSVDQPIARWTIIGVSMIGWAIVFYSSFIISHFDLFGLRQVFLNLLGRRYEAAPFKLTSLYKIVRHPLMVGFLIAFWATPLMTLGHLLFATVMTAYILIGVAVEERDLVAQFGEAYLSYRRRTPRFVPLPVRRSGEAEGAA